MTPRHTWHIVSGKGGTGKTTIAGGLACALATSGRRVLICEVEGRQGIAQLFDVPPLTGAEERRISRTPAGGTVYGLAIDAEDALMEYLDTFYHLSIAGKALDRFGAVDFATSIAPGLRDVLLTGKVYEAVRRKIKDRPNAYDAVVLDAPPTGRIAQFLNVHAAVAGLAKVGPIRNQADSIMRLLRSATTTVHLVTLLEDMPVTETEEAAAALRPTQIRIGTVIENMVTPTPLNDDQLQAAAAGSVLLKVPGLTVKQNKALASEFAIEAARTLQEQQRHDRLTALGLPLVQIALDHEGIDEGAILAIAEQLTDQMNLEAA
ncbi:MAG TPA: ArsA-related P-loop ATPase [Propionibacteriaceae bacterium]|nr:ArsA-related P-loop ATPase [Propionibacteriaceae bacterium]